jgi:hypothetical protein
VTTSSDERAIRANYEQQHQAMVAGNRDRDDEELRLTCVEPLD